MSAFLFVSFSATLCPFFLFICFFVSLSTISVLLSLYMSVFVSLFVSFFLHVSVCALAICPICQPVSPSPHLCQLVSLIVCIYLYQSELLFVSLSSYLYIFFLSLPPSVSIVSLPCFVVVYLSFGLFCCFFLSSSVSCLLVYHAVSVSLPMTVYCSLSLFPNSLSVSWSVSVSLLFSLSVCLCCFSFLSLLLCFSQLVSYSVYLTTLDPLSAFFSPCIYMFSL